MSESNGVAYAVAKGVVPGADTEGFSTDDALKRSAQSTASIVGGKLESAEALTIGTDRAIDYWISTSGGNLRARMIVHDSNFYIVQTTSADSGTATHDTFVGTFEIF